MKRFCAIVEYDGTKFFGFQRQRAGTRTVQGLLEEALHRIVKNHVTVLASGRTDSGVHATGQVIAFDVAWPHEVDALLTAINVNLPADIAVKQLSEVEGSFHPRFDAKRRTYKYYIEICDDFNVRRPLTRHRHWQLFEDLNLEAMNAAASHLIGMHDFATFGQPPKGDNTIREVYQAEWQREGDLLIFVVEANAFLYRMVRSIVGTLKVVGEGKWTVAEFTAAFHACDRHRAAITAPAHGLYLVFVTY